MLKSGVARSGHLNWLISFPLWSQAGHSIMVEIFWRGASADHTTWRQFVLLRIVVHINTRKRITNKRGTREWPAWSIIVLHNERTRGLTRRFFKVNNVTTSDNVISAAAGRRAAGTRVTGWADTVAITSWVTEGFPSVSHVTARHGAAPRAAPPQIAITHRSTI